VRRLPWATGSVVPLLLAGLLAPSVDAQIVASERGLVRQTIDGTVIELDYARPSVRGRDDLFGGLVPWGEIWTPGANEATEIRLSGPVEIEGVAVDAGAYSVWLQVNESPPWQLLLHPDTSLYHTAHPPPEEAAYRIDVAPRAATRFTETLLFSFPAVRSDGATLRLDWGTTSLPIRIDVEPSVVLTIPPEEGRGLAGAWAFGPPGEPGMPLTLRWDGASERVLGEWTQGTEEIPVTLVRRAQGIYQLGVYVGDSLGSVIDLWFFEFDRGKGGRPRTFEVRDVDDELRFEGRRVGG